MADTVILNATRSEAATLLEPPPPRLGVPGGLADSAEGYLSTSKAFAVEEEYEGSPLGVRGEAADWPVADAAGDRTGASRAPPRLWAPPSRNGAGAASPDGCAAGEQRTHNTEGSDCVVPRTWSGCEPRPPPTCALPAFPAPRAAWATRGRAARAPPLQAATPPPTLHAGRHPAASATWLRQRRPRWARTASRRRRRWCRGGCAARRKLCPR